MISRDPDFDPGQLPPRTEDFGFVNLTDIPFEEAHLQGLDGIPPGADQTPRIDLTMPNPPGGVPPLRAVRRPVDGAACQATRIQGMARAGNMTFGYVFDQTPPGRFICSAIIGVTQQEAGQTSGFGVETLDDDTQLTQMSF